jgi:hypothetical protein
MWLKGMLLYKHHSFHSPNSIVAHHTFFPLTISFNDSATKLISGFHENWSDEILSFRFHHSIGFFARYSYASCDVLTTRIPIYSGSSPFIYVDTQ